MKIDTDIPIPEARSGVAKPEYAELRHALSQLLIGSSFFYPTEKPVYVRNALWRLASTDKQFIGWRIATRGLFENEKHGIRTWRTK